MRKQDTGKKSQDSLGRRIRTIRGDLTQVEFANAVDIRQAMVSRYEADKETPSPKVLLRMSRYSGRSIEWMLTGADGSPARADKASAVKGALTIEDFVDAAAKNINRTQMPSADKFVAMMKDLFKDRAKMDKVLEYYNFVKKEQ